MWQEYLYKTTRKLQACKRNTFQITKFVDFKDITRFDGK